MNADCARAIALQVIRCVFHAHNAAVPLQKMLHVMVAL
jgi:hypothetical protein